MLRAFYRFEAEDVIRVFEQLLGLANMNVEEAGRVTSALDLPSGGLDFADVLHLAGCSHCAALYTFDDRRFDGRAQRHDAQPMVVVPSG